MRYLFQGIHFYSGTMRRKCSYPHCLTGSAMDHKRNVAHGLKKKTLFCVPRDPQRRKHWETALNRPLNDSEVICELHFHKKDILSQFKIRLYDGSIFKMNKEKSSLVKTAIPHLYNSNVKKENDDSVINIAPQKKKRNVANTCSTTLKNTKNLSVINTYTKSKKLLVMEGCTNTENLHVMDAYTNTKDLCVMDAYTNTQNLCVMDAHTESSTVMTNNVAQIKKQAITGKSSSILENIKNVHLPDKWTCVALPDSVVIGMWKPNGEPGKRLVVKSNLTIQAFIENEAINLPRMTTPNSVEDIMKHINTLQSLLLCEGRSRKHVIPWFSRQCLGFVDPKDSVKLHFGQFWCAHCRVIRRKNLKKKNIQRRMEIALLLSKRCNELIAKAERQRKKRIASKIGL
ncbi:PREDICTED: uncharacterized protein LOC105567588 [Vollenhovia emeryi]|uniref:uncharacterized protein LOC105567588 n=1 Tax=Vollenhovia emeryi TaxID=411798 RepID=UPI0005F4483C|nr:PREDICTED: uncharacterized protein LOC105567588 [Vollenhovia emeryi]XP_011877938.1 PREDICTED: uncharacterized protein LOC105567588 [Vollenhovia emeryi]XP_011877939.1 PREDICTED: uncharacterized protein LOC105567588 [Vollenhovia emeryi]XP_011877940.1 PREDICTED: uncharacterized protein LOC105567588 [Vollenhovia emeryi]